MHPGRAATAAWTYRHGLAGAKLHLDQASLRAQADQLHFCTARDQRSSVHPSRSTPASGSSPKVSQNRQLSRLYHHAQPGHGYSYHPANWDHQEPTYLDEAGSEFRHLRHAALRSPSASGRKHCRSCSVRETCSNGPVEGHVGRLKTIKRRCMAARALSCSAKEFCPSLPSRTCLKCEGEPK
jgi:hypothetical protein